MADKKIVPDKNGFKIPKLDKKSETKDITIKHFQTDKYDVYQKDFPNNLPDGYIWLNNFGVKLRKVDHHDPTKSLDTSIDDPYEDVVDLYTIELDDIAGKEPIYFDGKAVKSFSSKKITAGNNLVHVTLGFGDPPVGWPR